MKMSSLMVGWGTMIRCKCLMKGVEFSGGFGREDGQGCVYFAFNEWVAGLQGRTKKKKEMEAEGEYYKNDLPYKVGGKLGKNGAVQEVNVCRP